MRLRPCVLGIVPLAALLLAPGAGRAAQDATPATGELRIVDRQPIALGGHRVLGLSPDGRWLAAYEAEELCVYDTATLAESRCALLPDASIHWEAAAWSPDSQRIALTQHAAVTFVDSDVLVVEIETGEITKLTDDGFEGVIPLFDEDADPAPVHVDILPAWAPDGRSLAFVRSTVRDGEWLGTTILRVDLDGGEPEEIHAVTRDVPLAVYFGMTWTPDGERLLYTVAKPETQNPDNGLWIVEASGEHARQLVGPFAPTEANDTDADDSSPARGYPVLVEVSVRGDRALVFDPVAIQLGAASGPLYALVDLTSGELQPVEIPSPDPDVPDPLEQAGGVTFSPDGSRLLYALRLLDPPDQLVLIEPDGTHRRLAEGVPALALFYGRGLDWAANGTVFAADGPTFGTLLRLEGEGATRSEPTLDPATPEPAAPATPDIESELEVGATAVVNDANVALRGAPSTEAPIVAELAQGAAVTVLGPAEHGGGFVWLPVRDEETRAIGYVRREFLSSAPDS